MAEAEPDGVIVLQVASARYADDHPAWRSQVGQLADCLAELRRTVAGGDARAVGPALRLESPAGRRGGDSEAMPAKGAELITVLSLSSAQLVRSAALVVREWLRRDQSRSVSLATTADGRIVAGGRGDHGIEAAERAFRAALEGHSSGEPDGD